MVYMSREEKIRIRRERAEEQIKKIKLGRENIYTDKRFTREFCVEYYSTRKLSDKTLNQYHFRLRKDLMWFRTATEDNGDPVPHSKCGAPLKAYIEYDTKRKYINQNIQLRIDYSKKSVDEIIEENVDMKKEIQNLQNLLRESENKQKDWKYKIKDYRWKLRGHARITHKLSKLLEYYNYKNKTFHSSDWIDEIPDGDSTEQFYEFSDDSGDDDDPELNWDMDVNHL